MAEEMMFHQNKKLFKAEVSTLQQSFIMENAAVLSLNIH
jgi:hypothetical protein